MWPVNLDVEGALLKYASAQLLCKLPRESTYFFFAPAESEPECHGMPNGEVIFAPGGGNVEHDGGRIYVSGIRTYKRHRSSSGNPIRKEDPNRRA